MKQNIWIWNHYATNVFFDKGGRHFWFAKNLKKNGYNPTIFCASTKHNSDEVIEVKKGLYVIDKSEKIPFVFVKTPRYKGNGKSRILNMFAFYKNLFSVSKRYSRQYGKPDVILASSVHPLTLLAGIKVAKKFNVPCICEVRDLWPETLVAYGSLKRKSLIGKGLYLGEKWIYKKADKLIFTMEGGKDYIIDRGWSKTSDGPIDLNKVHHINNGIDLEAYDKDIKNNIYIDNDLDNNNIFKVIYAGSIRKINNLNLIIDVAKCVQEKKVNIIKFLIFGEGDELDNLKRRCSDESINNVIFKGKVEKRFIPNILYKSDLNILNYSYHDIWKYGGSQNKNFEYLASGKPVLSTITMGYDIIQKYNAGISIENQEVEKIVKSIIKIVQMKDDDYKAMSDNARKAAEEYDFIILTKKLIDIIESIECE